MSYKERGDGLPPAVYLCCHATGDVDRDRTDAAYRRYNHQARDSELGCTTLAVLAALGCTMRDLHNQTPEAADGLCRCGAPGYRVAGVQGGRPICLPHLLDATHQPRELLFGKWKRPQDQYPEKVCACGEPVLVGPDGTRYVVDDADPPTRHYCDETDKAEAE